MDERDYFGASGPLDPAARPGSEDAGFAGLSALLWREREVLDQLLYKLTAQQLFLRAGELAWLAAADSEVAAALKQVREFDVLRALEVHDLVQALNVPEDTPLRALAERAPEPWGPILADHRHALQELTARIAATTETNRRLLKAGAEAAGETLTAVSAVAGAAAGYGATGAPLAAPTGPFLLDRQA